MYWKSGEKMKLLTISRTAWKGLCAIDTFCQSRFFFVVAPFFMCSLDILILNASSLSMCIYLLIISSSLVSMFCISSFCHLGFQWNVLIIWDCIATFFKTSIFGFRLLSISFGFVVPCFNRYPREHYFHEKCYISCAIYYAQPNSMWSVATQAFIRSIRVCLLFSFCSRTEHIMWFCANHIHT